MPHEVLLPKLSAVRLKEYENRLNFPGEIFHFSCLGTPIFVCAAKVSSSYDRWVGGTHSDWLAGPGNIHGWKSPDEAIEKAVHKALDMRKKNLCHGLPFGGVKFTIFSEVPLVGGFRVHAYKLLGEALNFFNGHVFSGADVHTDDNDLMIAFGVSPFVLGTHQNYGGSGDPSPWTAVGVHRVIMKFFDIFYPGNTISEKIKGVNISIRGIGKVGFPLLGFLHKEGINMSIADIRPEVEELALSRFSHLEKVPVEIIDSTFTNVYAPCDKEVTITPENARELCGHKDVSVWRAIIGSANDQNRHGMELEDVLWQRRVVHLSQGGYLENGGGVCTVVAPLIGGEDWKSWLDIKIGELSKKCRDVMLEAKETNIAPARITEAMIEKEARETGNEL